MTHPNETSENAPEEIEVKQELVINQEKLDQYLEKLKLDQNLIGGLLFGLAASVIGGLAWAIITVLTKYQIGYMAIAIGLMVGFAVRYKGNGIDKIFGVVGAILALFGCMLGNYLSTIGFIADAEGLGYFETLSLIDISLIPDIMKDTFSPMDILFYALAIYEGYKFSFRVLTEQEIADNAGEYKKIAVS